MRRLLDYLQRKPRGLPDQMFNLLAGLLLALIVGLGALLVAASSGIR